MIIGINASNIKSVGGINHINNIIQNLDKNYKSKYKIEKIIIWASSKAYQELKKIKKSGILVQKVKHDNILYNLFWKLFYLNYLLEKNKCDIFFSLDGIVLRNYKKIVVLYQNLIPFNYQEIINYGFSFQTLKNIFTFFLYKFSTIYSDGHILLNRYGINLIEAKLGDLKNKIIIPHGVDNYFFKILKKKNNGFLNIIYVSPIDHYKHQWNVIEAVRQLSLKGLKIKLRLIGPISNKQSEKNLFYQIKKSNINKKIIHYYGAQSRVNIAKLMNKSDVFLFASSCESFGLTLLEGMASDLYILSSNKSGLNLTSENKAIYFDPLSVVSIKKSIIKFKNLSNLKKYENKNKTKSIAKKYKWGKTSDATFKFLKKINDSRYISEKKLFSKINFFERLKNIYFENIFITSYSINFFTPISIFFIFYLSGFKNISVQYAIILSIASFFTQIFSANARNIILADKSNKSVLSTIYYRAMLSSLIIGAGSICLNLFYELPLAVLVSPLLLVSLSWIKEISIASSENSDNKFYEFIFQIYYIITFSICFFLYYYNINEIYLLVFPIAVLAELIVRIKILTTNKEFNLKEILGNFGSITQQLSLAFWSGFFLTLLNIIIRILTDLNFTSATAADYFFCFSIATFPGTIVTSILGVSYLGKEKRFPFYFKFLMLLYFLSFIFSPFLNINYFQFNTNLAISVISITGLILVFSQSIRQLNIINLSKRTQTFKRDIIFFILSLLILLVFVIYLKNNFIFFILVSSLLSLIIYLIYYNPLFNHKFQNAD